MRSKQIMIVDETETHGRRPARLDPTKNVEVRYVTGRWCSGLPKEHQWNRITHMRNGTLDNQATAA